ncbi:MAG: alpha,alpha-trehalase TreF [Bacteroidota bacterium]
MRLLILFLLFSFTACQHQPTEVADEITSAEQATEQQNETPPDLLFGELFERVQMERIFPDGKTFVDCIPKRSPEEIMAAYENAKHQPEFQLRAFVLEYFELPEEPASGFQSEADRNIIDHINALWPVLTRKAGEGEDDAGSLLPLPNDYIVPGGRFREIYYWDSYFTLLGLKAAGQQEMIRNMVNNFAYLIDEVGFIPNGNRTYYLTRSQPPFFAAMVSLLVSVDGPSVYEKYLPQLRKEYDWWMEGADQLTIDNPAALHTVRMPTGAILNRYYDRGDRPRAESYREDVETIHASGRDSATVARHLRSGAESGWDYTSRWFADGQNISTIETTDIVPPDLNALLYHTELTLELAYNNTGNQEATEMIQQRRLARRAAMQQYLWNPTTNWYEDYHWVDGRHTGRLSLAGMYPFYFDVASKEDADAAFPVLNEKFMAPGGVRSTLDETGEQWDAPNGWPPLQYITIKGLEKYGELKGAKIIKERWLTNNERVYSNVNKMVEKYNVEDLSLLAGGGEYPVQDGFGWSNGVYLALKME